MKMMSMMESHDGIKFEFNLPLSQTFQAGMGWSFSNSKPPKFEVNTVLTFVDAEKMGPFANPDEMSMLQVRTDSTGFMELHSKIALGNGFSVAPEAFFMNN